MSEKRKLDHCNLGRGKFAKVDAPAKSLSSLDFIRVFKETQKCSSKHKTVTNKTEVFEC